MAVVDLGFVETDFRFKSVLNLSGFQAFTHKKCDNQSLCNGRMYSLHSLCNAG